MVLHKLRAQRAKRPQMYCGHTRRGLGDGLARCIGPGRRGHRPRTEADSPSSALRSTDVVCPPSPSGWGGDCVGTLPGHPGPGSPLMLAPLGPRDAFDGKGPQRRPQQRLGRRLDEANEAVGGRLLSVSNAVEPGTWRQGDSGWAQAGRPGGGGGAYLPPAFQCIRACPRRSGSVGGARQTVEHRGPLACGLGRGRAWPPPGVAWVGGTKPEVSERRWRGMGGGPILRKCVQAPHQTHRCRGGGGGHG